MPFATSTEDQDKELWCLQRYQEAKAMVAGQDNRIPQFFQLSTER